jgi:hypothetical protein
MNLVAMFVALGGHYLRLNASQLALDAFARLRDGLGASVAERSAADKPACCRFACLLIRRCC